MNELEDEIYEAFFTFINLCHTNEVVFPSDQNVSLPKGHFLVVKLESFSPVSWTKGWETVPTDNTGLTKTFTTYKGKVLIVAYGEYALSRLHSIASGLRERNTKQALKDKGLAYSSHSDPVDISARKDTKIEKRATMTVDFYFVQGGDDRGGGSGVIETVDPITPTYNNC